MVSRRRFLLVTAAVSIATAGGVYVAKPLLRRLIEPQLDRTSPVGTLDDAEMRTITSLGEVLAPEGHVPPAEFFREKVNEVTRTQLGFFKEYQRAVVLLNANATVLSESSTPRRFEDMTRSERDAVLRKLLWQYRNGEEVRERLEKIAASRDALALRQYVMKPLIEHYYRSPDGWAVVGYDSFPGRPPLDPRAYTRPLGYESTGT